MASTEKRILHSTAAAYSSQLGRTVLRLASDIALARLVLPEDHGLFALALSTVMIAGFIRDFGLSYELVRHPDKPYGSFLVWEATSGLLVTGLLMLTAPLFGHFSPGLPEVLRVLSIWVLIDAFTVVPRVFFERELAVTKLVVPEVGRGLVVAVVSISLAAGGAGVWSFVAGELVGGLGYMMVLWRLAWKDLSLDLDLSAIPGLLRRSAMLFVIALVANAVPFIDRYLVEIVDTTYMVGQYEKGHLWATRAQILIVPALVRVLYPALVAYRDDRRRFVTAYRLGTLGIVAIEAPVAYFLFFNAEIVILKILLGENWVEAVHLLRILCFLPLLEPFSRLGGEMLKVLREDRTWLAIAVTNVVCLAGFGWMLSHRIGPDGVAWAHYLMLGNFLMAWQVYKICGRDFWRLVRELLFVVLVPLLFFLPVAALFEPASWSRFAASVVAAALTGLVFLARFHRPYRDFFRSSEPLDA